MYFEMFDRIGARNSANGCQLNVCRCLLSVLATLLRFSTFTINLLYCTVSFRVCCQTVSFVGFYF